MKPRYFYLIALAVLALDQITKHLALSRLEEGVAEHVCGGLYLTLVMNPGGAFGLFQSWAQLLVILSVGVILAIVILVSRRSALPAPLVVSLALQLGGALGNLVDRVRFGNVVDFIDLRIWPVFNMADTAITVGVVLLWWFLIACERHRAKTRTACGVAAPSDSEEQ